jgi:predicted Fe-S protein YdhL (DUF1289 family)
MKNANHMAQVTASSSLQPDSPCVGRCSTAYGDDICKGCGRTFLEVVNWIVFDDVEKAAVWKRLENIRKR